MGQTPFVDSIYVDEWELRKMFNEARIAERGETGELRIEIKRSRAIYDSTIRNWIPGTLSQELRYYDQDDNLVSKAHRYLRPDGKLAASGLIDPKRVVRDGILYKVKHPDD